MEATRALAPALAGACALAVCGLSPAFAVSGTLSQLEGPAGCIVDETAATPIPGCATGRALLGARAVAISPDGRHAYVVAANSSAVAVFRRSYRDGALD